MQNTRRPGSLPVFAFLALLLPPTPRAEGVMVITGRPADLSVFRPTDDPPSDRPEAVEVRAFVTACLDYLAFGRQATSGEIAKRAAFRTAYILLTEEWRARIRFDGGYAEPALFWPLDADWKRAFAPGAFDAVIIGTRLEGGGGTGNDPLQDSLLKAKPLIESYFNRGGKLFVMAQSSYAFLPRINVGRANIYALDRFAITPAGYAIGLKDWSTSSQTISYRLSQLDTTVFKVFDRAREDGTTWYPITVGFNGFIEDTVFVPVVQKPKSSVPSTTFADSLCVDFSTATEGAVLVYTLDGTPPANLSPRLDNPGRLCFHATTTIRILGRKVRWQDSPDTSFTYTLVPPKPVLQVAKPVASVPSGTFPDSVCVTFSSATPGAFLHLTSDGRIPDSTSPLLPPSGAWCFRQSATVSLVATRPGMKASDTALFSYVLKPPRPPSALALYAEGARIDVVSSDQTTLEVRLARAAGAACGGCTVRVFPSGSADRESVTLVPGGGTFNGTFDRIESGLPAPGDAVLQHLATDSLVLVWINPEDPADSARRSYPYRGAGDRVIIRPHNDIARTGPAQGLPPAGAWILAGADGLGPKACCAQATRPLDARSPDSLRLVGLLIEASRGFALDLTVYSHLGEPVHRAALALTDAEHRKLPPGSAQGTRVLRLLWNGMTRDGSRAGNGVYIFKTTVALTPAPGTAQPPPVAKTALRFGILR